MALKERAKSAKTLICFLQSMVGHQTRVDVRDDTHLVGVIQSVDSYMNIELKDCRLFSEDNQPVQEFEYFFLKGSRVRYVHIPDDIDIIANIESQLALIQSRRQAVIRSVRRKETTDI